MQNRWKRIAGAVAVLGMALAGAGPARAEAEGRAALVVADDGGFDPLAVRALRALTLAALSERGVAVAHEGTSEGAARVFGLRVGGQLQHKIPLSLEETDPRDGRTLASASLIAIGLDEADRVIPRLVEAVLARRPVQEAGRFDTVTAVEAEAPVKRAGEGRWILGFSGGTLGMAVGWMHETRGWRLGPVVELYPDASPTADPYRNGESGRVYAGINGLWLPRDGQVSPYLGGGLGVVGRYTAESETDEVGAKLEGGVECFRLHRIRLLLGADLTLSPSRSWGAFHMRMAF
jgi:hypothetical protein